MRWIYNNFTPWCLSESILMNLWCYFFWCSFCVSRAFHNQIKHKTTTKILKTATKSTEKSRRNTRAISFSFCLYLLFYFLVIMHKHSILVIKLRGHAFSAYITNLANSQKSCPYSVCKSFSKTKRCDNAKIDLIDRIVWRNNTLVIEMCVLLFMVVWITGPPNLQP